VYIGSDFFKEEMKYNNNNNNNNNDISNNKFETPVISLTEVLGLNHGPEMRYIHFFFRQAVVNNSGAVSQIRSRLLLSTFFAPW
jgi:hypothetical protein